MLSGILLSWILWAVLTYAVGVFLFKGKTDIPEMMRVLGYANAPNLLGVFGHHPLPGVDRRSGRLGTVVDRRRHCRP